MIKNIFLGSAIILFTFALLELGSQIYQNQWAGPLLQAKKNLEMHSKWGWQQKAHINRNFYGYKVVTNELGLRSVSLAQIQEARNKILVLGPSSSFGWGVDANDTFSKYLERMVNKAVVVNAGQIGFSSLQGKFFIENSPLKNMQWNVVIIAYGINDVDRYRFYFNQKTNDLEEFRFLPSEKQIKSLNSIFSWSLPNILTLTASELRQKFTCPIDPGINMKKFSPRLRVSENEFIENIKSIAAVFKNTPIVLITTPYSFSPILEVDGEDKDNAIISKALDLIHSEHYEDAIHLLETNIKVNPRSNESFYILSQIYAHLNNCNKAKLNFQKTRDTEIFRIQKEMKKYNKRLRELAKESGMILVDGETLLPSDMKEFFVDPVHFSAKGHGRLAEEIFSSLKSRSILQ